MPRSNWGAQYLAEQEKKAADYAERKKKYQTSQPQQTSPQSPTPAMQQLAPATQQEQAPASRSATPPLDLSAVMPLEFNQATSMLGSTPPPETVQKDPRLVQYEQEQAQKEADRYASEYDPNKVGSSAWDQRLADMKAAAAAAQAGTAPPEITQQQYTPLTGDIQQIKAPEYTDNILMSQPEAMQQYQAAQLGNRYFDEQGNPTSQMQYILDRLQGERRGQEQQARAGTAQRGLLFSGVGNRQRAEIGKQYEQARREAQQAGRESDIGLSRQYYQDVAARQQAAAQLASQQFQNQLGAEQLNIQQQQSLMAPLMQYYLAKLGATNEE